TFEEPGEDSHRATLRSRDRERGVWSPYQSRVCRPMCSFGDNVCTPRPNHVNRSTFSRVHIQSQSLSPSQRFTTVLKCMRRIATRLRSSGITRSEEHTSELQSLRHLVCRLLLE